MSITTNWTGAGDGTSWDDPKNWDNGVPNGDYDAVIDAANAPLGTFNTAIQLTATDVAHSVTLNDATTSLSVTGELDVGTLDIEAGELDTSGTIATAAIYDPVNDVTNFYDPTINDPNSSVKVLGGTFDNITYQGTLEIQTGATLKIAESVVTPLVPDMNGNSESIILDAGATLEVAQTLTVFDLSGDTGNIVLNTGATLAFDDGADLEGGDSSHPVAIQLVNQSSIVANGQARLFADVTLNSGTATISGDDIAIQQVEADGGSTIDITATSFAGSVIARDGSLVTINALSSSHYDPATQTLGSGQYYAFGPSQIQLPDNSPVVHIGAGGDVYLFAYDLSILPPSIYSDDTATNQPVLLQQSLTTIDQFGTLELNQVTFTADHALLNNGLIAMGQDAVLDDIGLDNEGVIEGSGTIARDFINNGVVLAENLGTPPLLVVDGAVSGTGYFEILPDGDLEILGATSETVKFYSGGPLPQTVQTASVANGPTLILDNPASFTGTIDVGSVNATIEVRNVNAVSTRVVGDQLVVNLANGGTLTYSLSGDTSDLNVVTVAQAVWNGPSGAAFRTGDFGDAANWSIGVVPTSGTNTIISRSGSYGVTSNQDNAVKKLTISDTAATLSIAADSFSSLGPVNNAGTIAIDDGATLKIGGVFNNKGLVEIQSTADAATLAFSATHSVLTGGGTIMMSDSGGNAIGSDGTTALVNFDKIEGAGTIGNPGMVLVNHGLVEATGTAGLDIAGSVTGSNGTLDIADGSLSVFGGVSKGQRVNFDTGTGLLLLGTAEEFKASVAGFVSGDGIDLTDFAFADGAQIAHISGTGAAGTNTVVTITDGGLTAKIALINQYAGEFSKHASDYRLVTDATGATPGTLFELAPAHG